MTLPAPQEGGAGAVKRPPLVTLLAVVQFVSASLLLLFGTVELNDRRLDRGRREMFDTEMAVMALVLGPAGLACGFGLWRLQPYGRRLQILFAAMLLVLFPVGTIAGALVLVYMWMPGIRALFSGKPPGQFTRGELAKIASTGRPSGRTVAIAVIVLFAGGAAIGIVYTLAEPSLIRSRIAANEAAAIGSLHSIVQAQSAFAAANGGGYATSLWRLGIPCPGTRNPFIDRDLADERPRSQGYIFGMKGVGAPPGPMDCHGTPTETDFYATAEPMNHETGKRGFSTSAAGIVYERPGLPPSASDTFNGTGTPVR